MPITIVSHVLLPGSYIERRKLAQTGPLLARMIVVFEARDKQRLGWPLKLESALLDLEGCSVGDRGNRKQNLF
ncbi:MAG: hypothetical protein ABI614_17630 [Planctomycetota bacterium]